MKKGIVCQEKSTPLINNIKSEITFINSLIEGNSFVCLLDIRIGLGELHFVAFYAKKRDDNAI